MRKISLIICAFMLLLPALASAYTLQVKVAGGKTAVNTVTVNGLTTAGSGTYNTYPANTGTVTPTFLGTVASMTLDGSAYTAGTPIAPAVNTGGVYTRTLLVTFASAASYTVIATQPANGAIYVQQTAPSRSSNVAGTLSGIGGGATVVVSVYPNSGYSVSTILVGASAPTNLPAYSGVAGQAVKFALTATELLTNPTITATTAAVAQTVTASISVPGAVTLGSVSNFKGYASSNAINPSFVFDIYSSPAGLTSNPTTQPAITATGSTATFTANTVGTWIASLKINGTSNVAKAYFTVSSTGKNDINFCEGCHNGRNSALTNLYDTTGHGINASANGGHGPTCQKCHYSNFASGVDTSLLHTGVAPTNPATLGKTVFNACIGCHNGAYSRYFDGVVHFANATTASFKNISAAYAGYKGKGITACNKCHFTVEPHGIGATTTGTFTQNIDVLGAWADSDHGSKSGLAWIATSQGHNWRDSGSTADFSTTIPKNDCVRCHTADGFNNFFTSKFTNVNKVNANDGDQVFNSPLACNACHAKDVNFDTIAARNVAVGGVKTFYNISTVDKKTFKTLKSRIAGNFPDVGDSNICNSCHSARVVGPNLTDMFNTGNWDLSKASFQNSHYMAASGNMYMKTGFKNFTTLTAPAPSNNEGTPFTSSKNYNQTLTADDASTTDGIVGGQTSAHRKLGTPLITGSEDYLTAALNTSYVTGALETNGPCVTCHMQADKATPGNGFTPPAKRTGAGHGLTIDADAAQQLCLQCHADAPHLDGGTGAGAGVYTTITNLAGLQSAMLEPQSAAFQNGLALIKQLLLAKYNIEYDSANYPYFFEKGTDHLVSTNAVTDWTRKLIAGAANVTAVAALGTPNVTALPAGGLTNVQAYRLMGACFNLNVLARDPGAYVHARTYTQRLVYDAVDYLDNNLMDFTPLDTARALNVGVYSGHEANVLIAAPVGGLATESMAWLAGTHYTDSKVQVSVPLKLRP